MSPLLKKYLTLSVIIISTLQGYPAFPDQVKIEDLEYYLKESEKPQPPVESKEQIYLNGDVLFCTGDLPPAEANNRAAEKMLEGDYETAAVILEDSLNYSPLFFPFRYNLGLCYMHMRRFDRALLNLNRAAALVPEFSRTYLQIGFVYQLKHKDQEAMDYFRKSIKYNPGELDPYIYIGDTYFERGQVEMAKRYYDAALEVDPFFPNGLLGRAKVYFHEERYIHAINLLKTIDTSQDYDKSLHYYYGESAFKLRDYDTAAEQYRELLKYKADRFFLTHAVSFIEHKLEMSERLAGY